MPNYYNSFTPLAARPAGNMAVRRHGLLPFADGSCRREPDFESAAPSISSLCRFRKFAPHREYQRRARECGTFLVCDSRFVELRQPPLLTEAAVFDIMKKVPRPQTALKITDLGPVRK